MLTNRVRQRIELPHEPGEWVEVRALGHRALASARDVAQMRQVRAFKELGTDGIDAISALEARFADGAASADAKPADPLAGYDVQTLLVEGIVAWSYDAAVTQANVEALDERTARLVARALVPEPERESESERLFDFAPSTSTSTA